MPLYSGYVRSCCFSNCLLRLSRCRGYITLRVLNLEFELLSTIGVVFMFKPAKFFSRVVLFLVIAALPIGALAQSDDTFDTNRARLLGHMLQQQLSG